MDWTVENYGSQKIIRVIYQGTISIPVCLSALNEISEKYVKQPEFVILSDYRELDLSLLFIDDIRRIVDYYVDRAGLFENCRLAYLIKPGLQFGVFRQFHTLMEMYTDIEVLAFFDEFEAMTWLAARQAQAEAAG
ncbi:MAG: hypothetical protein JSS81_01240 [Acidobacteria bacterium]|nr:hypothetical protein [Acidobacteriota bacterium]